MMKADMTIYAEKTDFGRDVSISMAMSSGDGSGKELVANPITFSEGDDCCASYEPCLRLSIKNAQKLMDQLWSCGLRPTEGSGSAGSLAATERHLKDMQNIAKGLLKKEGVEV
jgi:hypothetical protein